MSKSGFHWRGGCSFFYCKNSITTSNQCGNFVLYTFLEKGGEQDENSRLGNENLKGVTLMELSKKSGIGKSTINNIENGKVSPTLFQLEMIAIALGVKITDLFESEYK